MHSYMQHIGDYRRDTIHLSLLEHGVYRQLLDSYYLQEQPLSGNVEQVARKIGARSIDEIHAVKNVLEEFFTYDRSGFCYRHARCTMEINAYQNLRAKGKMGGEEKAARQKSGKAGFLYAANILGCVKFGADSSSDQEARLVILRKRHGKAVQMIDWIEVDDMTLALEMARESLGGHMLIPESLFGDDSSERAIRTRFKIIAKDISDTLLRQSAASPVPRAQGERFTIIEGGLPVASAQTEDRSPVESIGTPSILPDVGEQSPSKPEKPVYSDAFNQFWSAYAATGCGRMGSRPPIYKKWLATKCEDDIELILKHIQWMLSSKLWRLNEPQYTPAPLVYVNQRKWDGWDSSTVTQAIGASSVGDFTGKTGSSKF